MRALWRTFAQMGIASHLHDSANRPHLTLAIYARLDVARAEQLLIRIARAYARFPLTISHLGAFVQPSAVAFLAPTVTLDLLRLHRRVHEVFADVGTVSCDGYVPGSWVPHCTIAFHMDVKALLTVMAVSQKMGLPRLGRVTEIGVAQVSPTTLLFSAPLSTGDGPT